MSLKSRDIEYEWKHLYSENWSTVNEQFQLIAFSFSLVRLI